MMAIQQEDQSTGDIFNGHAHPDGQAANDHEPPSDEIGQKRIEKTEEELYLAQHHSLVKVEAFIRDETKAKKKTAGAKRVEKFREKQKTAGLVPVAIPLNVAEAVKATEGGFPAWLETQKGAPVEVEKRIEVPVEVEKIVEKRVEVPAALTGEQQRLIALGQKVEAARGWRRLIVMRLLG